MAPGGRPRGHSSCRPGPRSRSCRRPPGRSTPSALTDSTVPRSKAMVLVLVLPLNVTWPCSPPTAASRSSGLSAERAVATEPGGCGTIRLATQLVRQLGAVPASRGMTAAPAGARRRHRAAGQCHADGRTAAQQDRAGGDCGHDTLYPVRPARRSRTGRWRDRAVKIVHGASLTADVKPRRTSLRTKTSKHFARTAATCAPAPGCPAAPGRSPAPAGSARTAPACSAAPSPSALSTGHCS